MIHSLRILCKIQFPSTTSRFWDGAGPYVDQDGNIWRQGNLVEGGLDAIEMAINAEAFTLTLGLSGLDKLSSDLVWSDFQNGEIIDSIVRIMVQECDERDQPIGDPDVKFTGRIDDITFDDMATDDEVMSTVKVDVVNRFSLRTLTNGSVLSDIDQKARSKRLNPLAAWDRICDRITQLIDKTIGWPAFS